MPTVYRLFTLCLCLITTQALAFSDRILAVVEDQVITESDLNRANATQVVSPNLVLNALIENTLLLHYAKMQNLGASVTEEVTDEAASDTQLIQALETQLLKQKIEALHPDHIEHDIQTLARELQSQASVYHFYHVHFDCAQSCDALSRTLTEAITKKQPLNEIADTFHGSKPQKISRYQATLPDFLGQALSDCTTHTLLAPIRHENSLHLVECLEIEKNTNLRESSDIEPVFISQAKEQWVKKTLLDARNSFVAQLKENMYLKIYEQ